MTDEEKIELMERHFRHGGGCAATCKCGKTFVSSEPGWTWEEDEYENAIANGAEEVDYSIGDIHFGCGEFVDACDCWHKKGVAFFDIITGYDKEIAGLLAEIKNAAIQEAHDKKTVVMAMQQLNPDWPVGTPIITVKEPFNSEYSTIPVGRHGVIHESNGGLYYVINLPGEIPNNYFKAKIWENFEPKS
jgi:hypothetical protein